MVRPDLDGAAIEGLLGQVSAVEWGAVHHAYGPATEVPGQLAADRAQALLWLLSVGLVLDSSAD